MHGDFSRGAFRRSHPFSRVLMQQGRVLLDYDWNAQGSIVLHYLRALAADLIGPHGGPGDGFKIICNPDLNHDFEIGWGHYYVAGILCENDPSGYGAEPLTYRTQPHFPLDADDEDEDCKDDAEPPEGDYLVYLDVWERHLTHRQADDIREVALGGPDTATRAVVVWQVKIAKEPDDIPDDATCADVLHEVVDACDRFLQARARVATPSGDPCVIPPESRYRGAENQLYRIEIHNGGEAGAAGDCATFKWSRDNGAVAVVGVRTLQGSIATVDSLGPDQRGSLAEDDWVEIVDDYSEVRLAPRPLRRVTSADPVESTVELHVPEGANLPVFDEDDTTHPLLRRWDQGTDVIDVQEGKWIDIEDGVQIYFRPGGVYRTGDHWLIPARAATGDVLWPTEKASNGGTAPRALPPDGVDHHYAPLARIRIDGKGDVTCRADCRCTFNPTETVFNRVFFGPDSETLGDDAESRLKGDAVLLNDRLGVEPDLRLKVRGFATSKENGGDPDALALDRAKRVAQLYVDEGIAAGRISAVARGAVDPTDIPTARRRRAETVLVSGCAVRRPPEHPVLAIDGVGDKFAKRLEAAGITDAAEVAKLRPVDLAGILTASEGRAVTTRTATSIVENARRLIGR